MRLGELIDGTGGTLADTQRASIRICDIAEDSRTVMPGSLFIARPGTKVDGRRFVEAAIESGAVAVLTDPSVARPHGAGDVGWVTADDVPLVSSRVIERFFGAPSERLRLVGVTGTNGKTTIAHAVQQLVNGDHRRCGLIGTVIVDDGFEVADASLTTPSALEISYALRNMVDAGYTAAALEVSSHALVQSRVGAIRFDAGVFTNLTGEHLDYHGTMEEYARAKSILFDLLREGGAAIMNVDDPWGSKIAREVSSHGARVLRCSMGEAGSADCRVRVLGPSPAFGMHLELSGEWGAIACIVPLIGEHNAMNVLQAVAAAHAIGVTKEQIASVLPGLHAPPGRLELIRLADDSPGLFHAFVDYAHSDDALEKALRAVRPLVAEGSKLILCFGCGGDRDRAKRPRSAKVACSLADEVVITVNDAHTEPPASIVRDILAGVPESWRDRVEVEADRGAAIWRAVSLAQRGDVVLICGKGHEKYQYLPDGRGGERRVAFEDRVVAREAVRSRAGELCGGTETRTKRATPGSPIEEMQGS